MSNTLGKGSLVFGLILIGIGSLFLMQNWYGLDWAWTLLATWWPLALIALGLWKVIRFFSYNSR